MTEPMQKPANVRWQFDHHRLDVVRLAQHACVLCNQIARNLGRGYGCLADQLRRAALNG